MLATSPDENKALVRRYIEDILNRGRLDLADEVFASTFVDHDPVGPPALATGPEGFRQIARIYRAALPDVRFDVEAQLAEGDKVATRWTARGTHRGAFMGARPTGREATLTGISIDRVARGRIVERWVNWDALGMARQLGVVPAASWRSSPWLESPALPQVKRAGPVARGRSGAGPVS